MKGECFLREQLKDNFRILLYLKIFAIVAYILINLNSYEVKIIFSEDRNESLKSWLYDVYNNELQDECLLRLTIGAMMVETLRKSIYDETGFRCSAGIANNKV